jgi:LmbE family N-acetylglucosaminyl deacetylase
MKHKIVVSIGLVLLSALSQAQQVRPAPSGAIYHEIAQMRNLVNVLYVAAHPDDENTRLLAYLVNDQHIRTGYLSLTRGDGGQNLLGSEQGEALGLIRTHELIEARKLDGAAQFFTRAVDFGFSKTHEETFKHWPRNTLASDAAWVMRRFRPDVVICRFPPDTMAGHGQHAASAIIAEMAFRDSGDPKHNSYQQRYYPAWKPKRLLLNTYRFGSRNTTSEDQYKLQVGQYVPAMGMGVGELAGQSRSIHKSQGAGTPSVPGMQTEYFKLVAGDSFSTSIFEGIDITWNRVGRPDIGTDLQQVLQHFDFLHPDASIPALMAIKKKIAEVKDSYWRHLKLEEVDKTILHCAGIMAELYAKQPEAVRGEVLPFTLRVISRSATPVMLTQIRWGNADSSLSLQLSNDTLHSFEHNISVPATADLTQPYWLRYLSDNGALYVQPDDTSAGLPQTPNTLQTTIRLVISGETFDMKVPLSYKKLDPVKGDIVEQLRIVPDATLEFRNSLLIAKPDGSVHADVRIHAYKDISGVALNITSDISEGKSVYTAIISLKKGADTLIPIDIKATPGIRAQDHFLTPSLSLPDVGALHLVQYNHLPTLQYFSRPFAKVLQPTWKCTAKRIGFVEGAGDFAPNLLRLAGMDVDVLKESDFNDVNNLKKYDAIITGIRAVNAEKRMSLWLPMLLQYAANGGTLIMQYNTLQDMATTDLGPYPMKLSAKRVTEEDAAVTFLNPAHRLLNYPNKITKDDFNAWVQERGLYFPISWDKQYEPLFSMNDEGEQALTGNTLYAKTGKGHYIYTTLSFSRQLPAGNKGAIRLLMNMLSVGK